MAYPEIGDTAPLISAAEKMHVDISSPDRAMLIEDNPSALDERIRLIHQAKEEIIIACYDIRDGESTRDILAAVLKKADEGVSVRILVDGLSAFAHMNGDLFHALAAHPGIEIRVYNYPSILQPWKFMGRMHDKYLIVDDFAFILGGRNMFDYFIGDYPTEHRSHDREILICNAGKSPDSALFRLRDYFEAIWADKSVAVFGKNRSVSAELCERVFASLDERYLSIRSEKPHLFDGPDYASITEETRGVYLIANPTGLYAKEPVVFQTLAELMKRAEKDIVIHSPYAVFNGYMRDTLKSIAANIPTTLMINARENGDNIVASSDYTYNRTGVLATDVRLLEYAGGDSYHGKSVAIDGDISVIGSFNFDLRSAYVDTELMLVVNSEAINAQLRENMAALHEDCMEIISQDETILPEGLAVPEAPFWKKAVWRAMGLLLQPVRILV